MPRGAEDGCVGAPRADITTESRVYLGPLRGTLEPEDAAARWLGSATVGKKTEPDPEGVWLTSDDPSVLYRIFADR